MVSTAGRMDAMITTLTICGGIAFCVALFVLAVIAAGVIEEGKDL